MGQQRAATWQGRGVYHGFGGVQFTMEGAWQGKDQAAMKSVSTFPGGMFTRIVVVNKDRGWLVMNDQVNELDKAALAEEKERLYGNWVATLLPLADRGFRLKHLGESKVADRAVTGVDIVSDGHRPVRLFFDKETGLIAKKETRGKPTPDKESLEEVIYSDYRVDRGRQACDQAQIHRGWQTDYRDRDHCCASHQVTRRQTFRQAGGCQMNQPSAHL